MGAIRKTKRVKAMVIEPVDARGAKLDKGWLLRTRARQGGAESKQKFDSYSEAKDAARQAVATGSFREVWVEEVGFVPRSWRDLDADRRERHADDRSHVLSIEDEVDDW